MVMKLTEKAQDKQDVLLQIRASLGRWQIGAGEKVSPNTTTSIIIIDRNLSPQQDLRQYEITENRGSYIKPLMYNITEREVRSKIKTLSQSGYKLVDPQFPDLQVYFRNGVPITSADILDDAVKTIEVIEDDRTGLEILMANWK